MTRPYNLPLAATATVLLAAGPVTACSVSEETAMAAQAPRPATTQAISSVEEVYGLWAIRAVEGGAGCRVSLSGQRDGANYGVLIERCTIPALTDAGAWRPVAGGFEILGADGTALMRFRMTGVDSFEAVDGRFKGARSPEM